MNFSKTPEYRHAMHLVQRDLRKKNGLCPSCGRAREIKYRYYCDSCRVKAYEKLKRYRKKHANNT